MFERKLCDRGIIAAASSPTECGTGTGSIMGFGGSSDNSKIKEKKVIIKYNILKLKYMNSIFLRK